MNNILIVDDDYATARSFASYLQAEGFNVHTAHSAEQAMRVLEGTNTPFDIAIVDIVLPESLDSTGMHFEGFNLAERLRQVSPGTALVAMSGYMPPDRIQALSGAFDVCLSKARISPQDIVRVVADLRKGQKPRQRPLVFIVHGHDDSSKLALKNYIQNTLELGEPIILHEQPSQGRTIIEQFEFYARKADIAFALLTPDDIASSSSDPDSAKRRARQNVIFELGFFYAKLQRSSGRVILLHKGDTEIPSDIGGLIYIDISKGIEAAGEEIRRELSDWL